MRRRSPGPALTVTEEAVALVLEQLREGPRGVHEISRATTAAQLDRNAVLAAAIHLKVRVFGKGGAQVWSLPQQEMMR